MTSYQLKLSGRKERDLRSQSHPVPLEEAQDKGSWTKKPCTSAGPGAWRENGQSLEASLLIGSNVTVAKRERALVLSLRRPVH